MALSSHLAPPAPVDNRGLEIGKIAIIDFCSLSGDAPISYLRVLMQSVATGATPAQGDQKVDQMI